MPYSKKITGQTSFSREDCVYEIRKEIANQLINNLFLWSIGDSNP